MNGQRVSYWVAGAVFVALAASFALCIDRDIRFGAVLNQTEVAVQEAGRLMAFGFLWLLGHGLHGAAVVGLPLTILALRGLEPAETI